MKKNYNLTVPKKFMPILEMFEEYKLKNREMSNNYFI